MSRARPSMYPTPPGASHWAALDSCAQGLHLCGANLQGAVNVLEQGTFDLPRLAGIVQSRRMFDVVTEKDIFESQRALANEMAPEIEGYIARAEDGLEELKQRERALQSKLEKRSQAASRPQAPVSVDQSALDALEKELAMLRNRKNRLGREVDQLEEKAARGVASSGAGAGAGGPAAAKSRPGIKVGIGRR